MGERKRARQLFFVGSDRGRERGYERWRIVRRKNLLGIVVGFVVIVLASVLLIGCDTTNSGNSNSSGGDSNNSSSSNNNDNSSTSGGNKGQSGAIDVVSREDGSGTRSAFVELFEVQVTNAEGKKVDATTTSAVVTSSTAVMMTTVSGDVNAIGYISLGSLNDTVKALDIDGVAATTANVKSGSYKISRPFNIVTKGTPNAATQDFINFIMSSEGQKVIGDNHYIAIDDKAPAYSKDSSASGKVVVAGSSSVSPVMEKLKEAYATANSAVTIEIQTSDSSTGISSTIEGICDLGMSSRALKDSEAASVNSKTIAIDGIAVIVNKNNTLKGMTKEQVSSIFLGEIVDWKDINN